MNSLRVILTSFLLALPALGQQSSPWGFGDEAVFGGAAQISSAVCATNVSQTTDNDYWYTAFLSQRSSNSVARTLCEAYVKVENTGVAAKNVHVEIWTAANRGGTQIGTASATNSIGGSTTAWLEFTWPSSPSLPAADFYITPIFSEGADEYRRFRSDTSDGSKYLDTTYCLYIGATAYPTSDLCVILVTQ